MGHAWYVGKRFFVNPDASSSTPYPQELNQWNSSIEEPLHQDDLTFCGEGFETLDMALGDVGECALAQYGLKTRPIPSRNGFYLGAVSALRKRPLRAGVSHGESADVLIATLSTETSLPKGRIEQPLDRSQSRGAQDVILLITNSSPTELASKGVAQNDIDELDRMLEDQDERRRVDERRTSNAENEVEFELVHGDGHGKRMEANTNEEVVWTLAEEHEDIQDDVAFVDGAWNKNAAVFEQKYPSDSVFALDADDAAPNDEVVKEAEAAAVEGEAVDFPEVDADGKHEATLRDAVAEEVLVQKEDRFLRGRQIAHLI